MSDRAGRVFGALLLAVALAGVIVGGLLVGALELGGGPSSARTWTARCLLWPRSWFDSGFHGLAAGATLIGLIGAVAAARRLRRERLAAVALRGNLALARLRLIPAEVATAAQHAGIADRLDVIELATPCAFVYGWRQPRVCVSTGLLAPLTPAEIEALLRHESWHVTRREPARRLVIRTLAAACWFVPPVGRLADAYVLASEIAADQHAVAAMGGPRWLASALVKTLPSPAPAATVVTASASASASATRGSAGFQQHAEARIAALAGEPQALGGGAWLLATVTLEVSALVPLLVRGGGFMSAGVWVHPIC